VAEEACHAVTCATQFGLTLVLAPMLKTIVFVALLFASQISTACECGFFSEQTASTSKVVFIFQVVGTELHSENFNNENAIAKIRIIKIIRGKPIATNISYSVSSCCGLALMAVRHYVAFLNENSHSFVADFDNVLALSPLFRPSGGIPTGIRDILRGAPAPERLLDESQQLLSSTPSPPCPPTSLQQGR
jgi:hypothetical protein